MKKNKFQASFWRILYQIGGFVVWFAGFTYIRDIPSERQGILALGSSTIWIGASILFPKIQNLPETQIKTHIRWRWIGIVELVLALAFITVIKPSSNAAFWAWGFNLLIGSYSFMVAYITIVAYFFPAILHEPAPEPNPFESLPESTRNVIQKGLRWATNATIIPIIGFYLIGTIGFFINTLYFNKDGVNFFIIACGLGFLIGFPLGFAVIYRWQQWARESGIPEEELKAAAKLVGLWWPNTKRPE